MAGDHPDVPFLQAKEFGAGRPDGPPLWIVWHTTEEDEVGDTAERVARYFATLSDGRTVSSHYVHDNNSSVQCVLLKDRAWTVGNRPGNYRGINIELAGTASQTAAQWADAYSQAMLRRACAIAARDMTKYKIPNRWCSVADLKAFRPGHTTHNDLRLAFGGTTHTDPGGAFPRAQVLQLVAGGEDNMNDEQAKQLAEVHLLLTKGLRSGATQTWTPPPDSGFPHAGVSQPIASALNEHWRTRYEILAEIKGLRAVLEGLATGNPDVQAILAGVAERLEVLRIDMEAEYRDAVADLGEGGSAQVRADV